MRKALVILAALACIAILLVAALRRPDVPDYARVGVLEHEYPGQITRLRALTQLAKPHASLPAGEIEADNALFSLPEILEARLEFDPNHILTLGHTFDWQEKTGSPAFPLSEGDAVVTRYRFKLKDGTRVNAVEYRATVHGPRGEVTLSILFNLDKLPRD